MIGTEGGVKIDEWIRKSVVMVGFEYVTGAGYFKH